MLRDDGIKKPLTFEPTARIDKVVESELFSVDDVDWSRLPELKKLAVEQLAIPNGHVTNIEVSRPTTAVGTQAGPLEIHRQPRLLQKGRHGGVRGQNGRAGSRHSTGGPTKKGQSSRAGNGESHGGDRAR